MKVSLKWLQEYVDVTLPPNDLASRLTMAGTEVKVVQVIGGRWEGITVGQITAINPHPNADRLTLVTVDLGTEQPTVVCGAPNLRLGDKVAFAPLGAQLIDGHSGQVFHLKSAKIRGVVSSGMVCSERELGISDSHEGILVLPSEVPVGIPLVDYLGDVILDLDITPNRPDCLSVIGIAWEVAALTGQRVHLPEVSYEESAYPIDQQMSVEIAAPELCRPINNIVDVTNYVMLEYGQPLHAFNYNQIRGKKIIVRRATPGEAIATLDGTERLLSEDMLVIADEVRAVAVAGVMGGADSEVTDETTSILLEAANFNPASIHHTGNALRLPSEARMRFERGISPELTLEALKRATQLIIEIAGGEVAQGLADAYPGRLDHKPIRLSTDRLKRLLGVEFDLEQVVGALTSLGFDCKAGASASEVQVTAPYWRSDMHQDVDLIEEVARIIGYDKIPVTLLGQPLPSQSPEPMFSLKQKVRCRLVGYGFQEVITYSLTSLERLNKLLPEPHSLEPFPLRMANPMTVEQEYLRPNLRANLLATLSSNRKHESGGIRLFELGKVYLPRLKDLPDEPEMLCGILSGSRLEESWHGGDGLFDFYDAKGVVEGLLCHLGVEVNFEGCSDARLHPNKQAAVIIAGNRLGVIGELHPKVLEAFEITDAYLFEINLSQLLPFTVEHEMFQPIPRFPAVERDIALIVDAKVTHYSLQSIIKGFSLVAGVTIFDVYSGKQVPPGEKSLAYRITFQSPTHTLTDDEVDGVQQQILDKLSQDLGATLRS